MKAATSRFEYPVVVKRDKDGGHVVMCRDLPEVVTQGETVREALAEAADAMDEAFAARIDDEREFPPPSRRRRGEFLVSPPAETVAKAALYVAMRSARVSKSELARRLKVDEKEVRRLLDPHHPSKLPRIARAVDALGQKLLIGLKAA